MVRTFIFFGQYSMCNVGRYRYLKVSLRPKSSDRIKINLKSFLGGGFWFWFGFSHWEIEDLIHT